VVSFSSRIFRGLRREKRIFFFLKPCDQARLTATRRDGKIVARFNFALSRGFGIGRDALMLLPRVETRSYYLPPHPGLVPYGAATFIHLVRVGYSFDFGCGPFRHAESGGKPHASKRFARSCDDQRWCFGTILSRY
jgi:hypothetical protein